MLAKTFHTANRDGIGKDSIEKKAPYRSDGGKVFADIDKYLADGLSLHLL